MPLEAQQGCGALLINQRHGLTAGETEEQIRENADIQISLGLDGYSCETPFDPSLMIHFR